MSEMKDSKDESGNTETSPALIIGLVFGLALFAFLGILNHFIIPKFCTKKKKTSKVEETAVPDEEKAEKDEPMEGFERISLTSALKDESLLKMGKMRKLKEVFKPKRKKKSSSSEEIQTEGGIDELEKGLNIDLDDNDDELSLSSASSVENSRPKSSFPNRILDIIGL
ncbi:uncharacterized protein LOC111706492 isoform X2 [Eurytemora carolleeae]|uniref:uncharacterized protein LOC111706492 isoform X2 n=1 Tax=Eurytemora carolleeae TaxID=1294199 RepID=UPI000C75EEF1|nr:uncharacterized protein LOC111706492 isoform X2 [Eurytemora carolleeae]|eukprot:XP_023335149.1 uncharacterized protein LOC111706492 isoform X2 [Eurytemora affinis]